MMEQKLPLGIVDFRELRTPDGQGRQYVYVDKTEQIHRLVNGSKFNFLSRPRRFGKSLLHSVLYHLYTGDRELFEGLWIAEEGRWNWAVKRPVVRIDFNTVEKQSVGGGPGNSLEAALCRHMDHEAQKHNITLTAPTAGGRLFELIQTLYKQTGLEVVVLVDEYDKPIVNNLELAKRTLAETNRETLRDFYSVLKGNETAIHFMLLTGVSKFGKLSIFSDLSNLTDITTSKDFATLLGYSKQEIALGFAPWLNAWCQEGELFEAALWDMLTRWYNGYSWNGRDFLYNPWSILHALKEQAIEGYWAESGTPKMLVDLLKEQQVPMPTLEGQWVTATAMNQTSLEAIDPIALFWQTGYLTAKGVKTVGLRKVYRLELPNREVRESFLLHYLAGIAPVSFSQGSQLALALYENLEAGNVAPFMAQVNMLLAKVPYHLYPNQPQEGYYHTIVYLAMMLSGHNVAAEVAVGGGRIDAVLETADAFYVFEFKMTNAQEAIAQIKDRSYHAPYQNQGKRVVLVGVAFDAEARTIGGWETETVA